MSFHKSLKGVKTMEANNIDLGYQPKDFKSEVEVRWCPGCGDFAILNALHRAMSELNIHPHETAVISGIGCSSRLPYYMSTYGMHTIHGRAAAIASGVKVANPNLNVWVISGDGDSLAIGGNHFIHAVRRNIDLNLILFNNKIYGLTKGQYSPTSDRGFKSISSPLGTIEDPFRPSELCFGARGTFFARAIDVDIKNTTEMMKSASKHKGTSVVEVLQNCVIFNDKIHDNVANREWRAEKTILLKQGEKMVFGANNDKGIVLDGWHLKAVTIGEDGYTLDDVLVHDATTQDNTLHIKLGLMGYENDLPVALGVIRSVEALVYDQEYEKMIEVEQQKDPNLNFTEFVMKNSHIWEVE